MAQIRAEADGPSGFSISPGDSVTLRVKAEGGAGSGNLSFHWMDPDDMEIAGQTADTLTIKPEKTGTYSCFVTDEAGNDGEVRFDVAVNHMRAWRKGSDQEQTSGRQYVKKGTTVRMQVDWDADDRDVTFAWEDMDSAIEGADGDTLTSEPVTGWLWYRCTVSDRYGNKKTVDFSLDTIAFSVKPEGCEDGENESVFYAESGSPATLKVVLTDTEEGDTYTYRWIDNTDARSLTVYGATSDTYVVQNPYPGDHYTCRVTNQNGIYRDAEFRIRTNHFHVEAAAGQEDGIVTAAPGQKVTLRVKVAADDTSALTYTWLDDGDVQQKILTDTPGACKVLAGQKEGNEYYYCWVRDQYGNEDRIRFCVKADKNTPVILEITDADVAVDLSGISGAGIVYDGEAKEPAVAVTVDGEVLVPGTDYEVMYSDNVNAGADTAKVTVTGRGYYTGTVEKTFSIARADQKITAKAGRAKIVFGKSTKITVSGAKGTVSYSSSDKSVASVDANGTVRAVKPGTAKITVRAAQTDNYKAASKKVSIEVQPAEIPESAVSVKAAGLSYNGKAQKPAVTVTVDGKVLARAVDYDISYSNNINAGTNTAKVTVTGKGSYTGTVEKTFTIARAEQKITAKAAAARVAVGKSAKITVSGAKGKVSYSTSSKAIATVSSNGTVKAVKVGKVKITITAAATSNFRKAVKTVEINIVPAATTNLTALNHAKKGITLSWKKVAGANGYIIYRDNKNIKTITGGATVDYTDPGANTNGTKYVYKVVAKASTGTSTLSRSVTTYRIDVPVIKSLTNSAASKAAVKWGKNAKATGYEIQYSLAKDFSGAKTVKISGAATVSKTIAKLTKGKTWYFRIRTCKKAGTVIYYSAWSAAKTVKITK